jgi:hypothetical protein
MATAASWQRLPAAPSACGGWTQVPTPQPANGSELAAVAAPGAKDAWAVGLIDTADHNGYGLTYTLAEHWDGSSWSIVPTQTAASAQTEATQFDAVAAVSGSDIWAVGQSHSLTGTDWIPLTEHFDGASWTVVPTPAVPGTAARFGGVAAAGAHDVWAVGSTTINIEPFTRTLIEHWDGHAWTVVPSPNPGPRDDALDGVLALATNDVWAVGAQTDHNLQNSTLIEHWDGTAWSVVPSPNIPNTADYVGSLAANGPDDIWAAGSYYGGQIKQTGLFEHWDGSQWSIVNGPSGITDEYQVDALAAVSPDRVFASGWRQDMHFSLAAKWNGGTWKLLPSESPSPQLNDLEGLAGIPGTTKVWAVGTEQIGQTLQAMIERSC